MIFNIKLILIIFQDFKVAEDYGVTDFPVLVYYENEIPNVFEGNLSEEEEVLQWLITQKTEDRIELITRTMLESFVEDTQYLAVYFCKNIITLLILYTLNLKFNKYNCYQF